MERGSERNDMECDGVSQDEMGLSNNLRIDEIQDGPGLCEEGDVLSPRLHPRVQLWEPSQPMPAEKYRKVERAPSPNEMVGENTFNLQQRIARSTTRNRNENYRRDACYISSPTPRPANLTEAERWIPTPAPIQDRQLQKHNATAKCNAPNNKRPNNNTNNGKLQGGTRSPEYDKQAYLILKGAAEIQKSRANAGSSSHFRNNKAPAVDKQGGYRSMEMPDYKKRFRSFRFSLPKLDYTERESEITELFKTKCKFAVGQEECSENGFEHIEIFVTMPHSMTYSAARNIFKVNWIKGVPAEDQGREIDYCMKQDTRVNGGIQFLHGKRKDVDEDNFWVRLLTSGSVSNGMDIVESEKPVELFKMGNKIQNVLQNRYGKCQKAKYDGNWILDKMTFEATKPRAKVNYF